MRLPTTIRGYMSLFRNIESNLFPTTLKGFDDLPKEIKDKIELLDAEISNAFNEIEPEYYEHKKTLKPKL